MLTGSLLCHLGALSRYHTVKMATIFTQTSKCTVHSCQTRSPSKDGDHHELIMLMSCCVSLWSFHLSVSSGWACGFDRWSDLPTNCVLGQTPRQHTQSQGVSFWPGWVFLPNTVDLMSLLFSCVCCDQVMVTVWKREAEKAEVQELGYLSVLQQREPTHTFRHDLNTFKAQGKAHREREGGGGICCSATFKIVSLFTCNTSRRH